METGTSKVAVEGINPLPCWPTVSWNVRFNGAETGGVMNVAAGPVAFRMLMIGSPGFTTCVHVKGPACGKLPCALRVTSVPPITGSEFALKPATAWVEFGLVTLQDSAAGGCPPSGQGLSWPIVCVT